ncbi:MAG: AbrB/MazE/SpoVT family DNA-binding domain-containing protein [Actinomycetota bacterium]
MQSTLPRAVRPVGVQRRVDDLGRIVLPSEMRKHLDLKVGDALDIALQDESIVLRKVADSCVFCRSTDDLHIFRDKRVCKSCTEALGSL